MERDRQIPPSDYVKRNKRFNHTSCYTTKCGGCGQIAHAVDQRPMEECENCGTIITCIKTRRGWNEKKKVWELETIFPNQHKSRREMELKKAMEKG